MPQKTERRRMHQSTHSKSNDNNPVPSPFYPEDQKRKTRISTFQKGHLIKPSSTAEGRGTTRAQPTGAQRQRASRPSSDTEQRRGRRRRNRTLKTGKRGRQVWQYHDISSERTGRSHSGPNWLFLNRSAPLCVSASSCQAAKPNLVVRMGWSREGETSRDDRGWIR